MSYTVEVGDLTILIIPAAINLYPEQMLYNSRGKQIKDDVYTSLGKRIEKDIYKQVTVGRAYYDYAIALDSVNMGITALPPLRRKLLKEGFKQVKSTPTSRSYWLFDYRRGKGLK